jgi:hypothetical protein
MQVHRFNAQTQGIKKGAGLSAAAPAGGNMR